MEISHESDPPRESAGKELKPVADPGGPQGAMAPKRWTKFFSHFVLPITDRLYD